MSIVAELSFAFGYYQINAHGVVIMEDDIPPEMRKKFWEVWPGFRKKVIEMQNKGIVNSNYPPLPLNDPEENRKHYENVK